MKNENKSLYWMQPVYRPSTVKTVANYSLKGYKIVMPSIKKAFNKLIPKY